MVRSGWMNLRLKLTRIQKFISLDCRVRGNDADGLTLSSSFKIESYHFAKIQEKKNESFLTLSACGGGLDNISLGSDRKADIGRGARRLQQTRSRKSALRGREKRRQADVVHLADGRTEHRRAQSI